MASQKEVAAHIDLTTRQVRTLVGDGVLPAGDASVGMDLDACRIAYIRYQRNLASKMRAPTAIDQEKIRLTRAQAERAEAENQIRQGAFIPAEMHDAVIGHVASEIARQMSGLPGRVAGVLAGISEPALVRARMVEECNGVRNAVASHMEGLAGALAALEAEPDEVVTDKATGA